MTKIKQKLAKLFETVDWREFKIGMIVHLIFFILIAVGMIVTKTWEFDIVLVLFFGSGVIVSAFFNLMNPSNQKKDEHK